MKLFLLLHSLLSYSIDSEIHSLDKRARGAGRVSRPVAASKAPTAQRPKPQPKPQANKTPVAGLQRSNAFQPQRAQAPALQRQDAFQPQRSPQQAAQRQPSQGERAADAFIAKINNPAPVLQRQNAIPPQRAPSGP